MSAPRLGRVPDEHVAVRVEAHDAREEPPPLLVRQDVHAPVADARDDGVRGAEVDADDAHRVVQEISQAGPQAVIAACKRGGSLSARSASSNQRSTVARERPHPAVVAADVNRAHDLARAAPPRPRSP